MLVVDKLGRRILLALSALFMCISITGLGVYFYLDEDHQDVSNLGWLPLACLIIFICAFSLGFGPLAWAMNVELFPRYKIINDLLLLKSCFGNYPLLQRSTGNNVLSDDTVQLALRILG